VVEYRNFNAVNLQYGKLAAEVGIRLGLDAETSSGEKFWLSGLISRTRTVTPALCSFSRLSKPSFAYACRQHRLYFLPLPQPRPCHVDTFKIKSAELIHAGKMFQPCVCHLGMPQVYLFKSLESRQ
jgi:hypothetical protein